MQGMEKTIRKWYIFQIAVYSFDYSRYRNRILCALTGHPKDVHIWTMKFVDKSSMDNQQKYLSGEKDATLFFDTFF